MRIAYPKSTPKISATATGPGVGGIKLCVTASPVISGKAKCKMCLPLFSDKALARGRRIMSPTSKKTGMATINPVMSRASLALDSPPFLSRYMAKAWAPPECSKKAPKIAPKPMIVATKAKVLPMPLEIDSITSVVLSPPRKPTHTAAISKLIKALSFNLIISVSKRMTPVTMAKMSCSSCMSKKYILEAIELF